MNEICKLLDIKYPILQGGMAWVGTAELAAAVSNAGGLGIIGSGFMTGELLDSAITKCKSLTDKPFGVNIMLMSPYVDEVVNVVCRHRVKAVTTGAGNPGKYVEKFKNAGIVFMPLVPSVALAKRMEASGADAVVCEGTEAGGHIGELTTMVLTPQIRDALSIPVIAAGGIADGRGMAAAFCLGASGVQIGTRFICASEGTVSEAYKEAVINAKDRDAVVTARVTGHPVRCLKNKLTKEYDKLDKEHAAPEAYESLGSGALAAAFRGDVEMGSVMAGQSAALVKKIQPAKEIIEEIMAEANEILKGLNGGIDG